MTKKNLDFIETRGRPKKYTDEYIEKTLVRKLNEWIKEKIEDNKPLWIKGFALDMGINPNMFERFVNKEHPLFSVAYKNAIAKQEQDLLDNALTGKYNSPFAMFVLKNNHGWVDKHEQVNTNYEGFKPPKEEPVQASETKRTAFLSKQRGTG